MRVLVATDLREASDEALRQGAALAFSSGGALGVVHVLPPLHPVSVLDERSRDPVKAHVARLADHAEIFVEAGSDYVEILKRADAWRADIVLVGAFGQSNLPNILGGVAERVVRYAQCPVLVVRPGAARGWVVAATDLSEPSLPAVAAAAKEARRRGALLRVVHVVGFLEAELTYLAELASPSIQRRKDESGAAFRQLADAVARLGEHVDKCAILEGPVAASIVRDAQAHAAELIVVGTHGRTGFARLALGSVAEKVVRAAPCSVLAVRLQPEATA